MADETTYLELSQEGEGSHKFYEVTVKDKTMTIRFGRIGDQGQTSAKAFPTADAARAEAAKKLSEKKKKGYAQAVQGVRQKRAVTRRETTSAPSTAKRAPVLWKFETGTRAFGIFVDDDRCWVGNEKGQVFATDHDGQVTMQFVLPEGVKCLVADDVWIYAGCDDGNVYDLTGKVPRLAYAIAEGIDIYWLDIWGGFLGVSDAGGGVTVIGPEEETLWSAKSGGHAGWMARCDRGGVYHGHSGGVHAYKRESGKLLWKNDKPAFVLFGWQTAGAVYAGTGARKVYCLDKKTGKEKFVCDCDASVMSNAASEGGKYVFAGDNYSSVYCFDEAGQRLWKLGTGCGSALSMQFHQDKLYLVTTDGTLACLDASESAVQAAQAGTVPKAREIRAPKPTTAPVPTTTLETTAEAGSGVVVECVSGGGKLRVRVASPGYHGDWNVQFPRNLREEGARYVVQEVHESAQGGFYRAYGDIRKLAGAGAPGGGRKRSR